MKSKNLETWYKLQMVSRKKVILSLLFQFYISNADPISEELDLLSRSEFLSVKTYPSFTHFLRNTVELSLAFFHDLLEIIS